MRKFVNKKTGMAKKILFLVLICCISFCLSPRLFSNPTGNDSDIIRNIEYKYDGDNIGMSQEVVESHVRLRIGEAFSPFLADSSIKALYASEKFEHVSVKVNEAGGAGGYNVVFFLTPRRVISSVDFIGNEHIKSKVLRSKVASKPDVSLSNSMLKSDVEGLKKFYHERGYPYMEVSSEVIQEGESGENKVTFHISEGDKFHIGKIEFLGNNAVKKSELLKAMRTKKWTLLSIFNKSGLYDPDIFSTDIDVLKAVFRNHGRLDIKIPENDIIYERSGGTLHITIPVDPGQEYYIGNIAIKGNKLYKTEELKDILTVESDEIFCPAKIEASCERMRNFYGKSGYINTTIYVNKNPNLASNKIDLEFVIGESERCFINEIEICGNSKTKNKVILRELTLAPGDAFDIVRMKNSRARLMNTGYFSFVDIAPIDTKVPERKNLRVDVKEAETGRIGFGGGISTGGEMVGFVEFSQRNFDINSENKQFQGGGQKFRSRFQMGKHTTAFDINFEEPWWYDREIAIGGSVFFHKSNYDKKAGYAGANYNEGRGGLEAHLRKRIYELWEGKLTYSLENVNIYDISRFAPPSFHAEKGKHIISKLTLSLERDSRDNFIYPTTGSRIGIDTEWAGGLLLGQKKFIKVNASGIKHWLVSETAEQVFSILGRVGTIMPYGGGVTPFFERFYMGGANFMKGFKAHDIGPKEFGVGVGGNTYAYVSTEYCIKIANPLRFYVFAEAGFVNEDKWNFSTKRYNTDAGFGLKISIMNMPLRLDFGFPLHGEGDNKHGMQFNYSFGVAF
jgi:outer membrane protein insertion porin family